MWRSSAHTYTYTHAHTHTPCRHMKWHLVNKTFLNFIKVSAWNSNGNTFEFEQTNAIQVDLLEYLI